MVKRCVIIGAGDLTLSQIPVKEKDYVIAADGGFAYCRFLGIEPDLVIGDLDSLSEDEAEALQKIRKKNPDSVMILPCEKDETDMLAAIHAGLAEGCLEFHIYGGQGGRLDHTLANIQCLVYLKECGATGYLVDGTGMILVVKDETVSFKKETEGMLSLFSLCEKCEGVTIENMKYNLKDYTMVNSFPVGISNEFIGEAASITVKKGSAVIILSW